MLHVCFVSYLPICVSTCERVYTCVMCLCAKFACARAMPVCVFILFALLLVDLSVYILCLVCVNVLHIIPVCAR